LERKASRDEAGMHWIQAEQRTRPDFVLAQKGLMQGEAGIGLWRCSAGPPSTPSRPFSPA